MNTYEVNNLPGAQSGEPSPAPGFGLKRSEPAPLVYTVDEAAAALKVSTKTIRRLLDRGILTSSKALRKKLIPRQQIEDFMKVTCDKPKAVI